MSGRYHRSRGFYKDSERGAIMGVCAGIANYFDLNKLGVRLIAVIGLMVAFWPVLISYLVAGVMLRDRPLNYSGHDDERNFWRTGR